VSAAEPLRVLVRRAWAGEAPTDASERVAERRRAARAALGEAAAALGIADFAPRQAPSGVPLPHGPWHWSLSHSGALVAAGLWRAPIGIDVERVAERRAALRAAVADEAERALFGAFDARAFTRLWSAKEAVLKAAGVGLAELSSCRVRALVAEDELCLEHRGAPCTVRAACFEGYALAVHARGERWRVAWDWPAG